MTVIASANQAAAWIRERISDGTYPAGEKLPTHTELAEELGVSRQTVMSAVRQLVHEGLLLTDGRRGTRVRERVMFAHDATRYADWEARDPSRDAFMTAIEEAGRSADKGFSMRIEPATPAVAARLGIEPKALVCVRSVLEFVDSQPWNRSMSYYPLDLAQSTGLTTPDDIPGGTVRHLAEQGYVECAWHDEMIGRPPDPDESRELAIPPGTGLLIWIRTAATAKPKQVINRCTIKVMPADRNAVIHRQGDASGQALIDDVRKQHDLL